MTETPNPESTNPPATTQLDTSKLVSPSVGADLKNVQTVTPEQLIEPTPVHDEVVAGATSPAELDALDPANSFKVDVKRALDRQTDDGKGDEDPGESDFQGFATDGVEKEEGQ